MTVAPVLAALDAAAPSGIPLTATMSGITAACLLAAAWITWHIWKRKDWL